MTQQTRSINASDILQQSSPQTESTGNYKWYVLALLAMTHTLVVGMPNMALPVLFDEIGSDLGLDLIQIGVVWGAVSLTGIVMAILGGVLGDRFGSRRMLIAACIIAGLTGAMRGFAFGFISLAFTVLIAGIVLPAIPTNVHKTCAVWFSGRRLATANGIVSAGMALGFMLGALLSATFLSPMLGGWRNVIRLYAAIAIAVGIIWIFTRDGPQASKSSTSGVHFREGLAKVVKLRNIWFLSLGVIGVGGCVQGTLGYLPLYLRSIGWAPVAADATLSLFHATSLLFTIPIAILSDRTGYRRRFLMIAALMIAGGVATLSLATGSLVWLAVILAGCMRDGFMAVLMTTIVEVKGVGVRIAGTATGVILSVNYLGAAFAPPIGNSFASYSTSAPFLFWSALAVVGFTGMYLVRDTK